MDIPHELHGCVLEGPEKQAAARADWQEALAGSGIAEPKVEENPGRYVIREYRNGFVAAAGSIRFVAGLDTYTDGSAKYVGTRFANCSGAVVQPQPDGGFLALAVAANPDNLQSAVSGEMIGMELLALVLARGTPEGLPHDVGNDGQIF